MRKKIVVIVTVIVIGLVSGYYSGFADKLISKPVQLYFSLLKSTENSAIVKEKSTSFGTVNTALISEQEAVEAVKSLPFTQSLMNSPRPADEEISFEADRQPTGDNPIWSVQLKQTHPEKISDILFFRVDAVNGKVLNLQVADLQFSQVGLLMTEQQVLARIGRPLQSKTIYDQTVKQKVEVYSYEKLEIYFDNKGQVVKLKITGTGHRGPRGIEFGMSEAEAVKLFGRGDINQPSLLIYDTLDDKNVQFYIRLDNKGKIVEMTTARRVD